MFILSITRAQFREFLLLPLQLPNVLCVLPYRLITRVTLVFSNDLYLSKDYCCYSTYSIRIQIHPHKNCLTQNGWCRFQIWSWKQVQFNDVTSLLPLQCCRALCHDISVISFNWRQKWKAHHSFTSLHISIAQTPLFCEMCWFEISQVFVMF